MTNELDDLFNTPSVGGSLPAIAQLRGRHLLILPSKVEQVTDTFNPGKMRPRITAHVVVLDGPTITHKESDEREPVELPEPFATPGVLVDFYISGAKMVSELKPYISAPGQGKPVVGKLVKLPPRPGQKGAWSLDRDAVTAEGGAAAVAWWRANGDPRVAAGVDLSDPWAN